jgi:ribA/ribD-fused uncharacterized protein
MPNTRDIEALRKEVRKGWRPKYLFFWGHQPRPDGKLGNECLSQWWGALFMVEDVRYPTTEHFMMAEKARLFGDLVARERIIAAPNPDAAKRLGREVNNFNEQVWQQHRFAIVVQGNLAKFGQNAALRKYLLETGERVLVEASPVDRIWGIGMAANDSHAENPEKWRGLNLLGFALMEVRDRLRTEN